MTTPSIPAPPPPPPPGGPAGTAAASVVTTPGIPGGVLTFPFAVAPLNQTQIKKKINKAKEDAIAMRKLLWPEIGDDQLWLISDKKKKGFSSLPRTMPLLMNLIADASKRVSTKSIPAGKAYLVLWCRVFGEGFVKIDNEMTAASEAGYMGERSVSTWREHLRVLKELGFIDYKPGSGGPMNFILLLNPYQVVNKLRASGWVNEVTYASIYQRAMEIGAGPDLAA